MGSCLNEMPVPKISNSNPLNLMPGSGTYEGSMSYELKHSVRMVRDYVDTSDKPPKWCKPVVDTPAPDEYLLDKFMKKKRFKHTSSAPTLGKALAMSIKA